MNSVCFTTLKIWRLEGLMNVSRNVAAIIREEKQFAANLFLYTMLRHLSRAGNQLWAARNAASSIVKPVSAAASVLPLQDCCQYHHHGTSQLQQTTAALERLSVSYITQNSSVAVTPRTSVQTEYKLPAVMSNSVCKKTILDPLINPQLYKLPTYQTVLQEKVSPELGNESPKVDPLPLVIRKEAAWLVRIRHKKMKKHKLKKLRKKMYFWNKKQTDIKMKKKEKMMQLMEKQFAVWADEFDAEKHVEERIEMAKKGGWGINIFETRKQQAKQ